MHRATLKDAATAHSSLSSCRVSLPASLASSYQALCARDRRQIAPLVYCIQFHRPKLARRVCTASADSLLEASIPDVTNEEEEEDNSTKYIVREAKNAAEFENAGWLRATAYYEVCIQLYSIGLPENPALPPPAS